MTIEVQMLARRPKGPGEWYEKGVTYPLSDDLANAFVRNGVARRTFLVSEVTDFPAKLQASGRRYDVQDGLVDPIAVDTASGLGNAPSSAPVYKVAGGVYPNGGTSSDIQAALDWIKDNGGGRLNLVPFVTYVVDSPITVDIHYCELVGQNNVLDATTFVGSGSVLTLTSSGASPNQYHQVKTIGGFTLKGSDTLQRDFAATGIFAHSDVAGSSVRAKLSQMQVLNFYKGFAVKSNSYFLSGEDVDVYRCKFCLYQESGASNLAEGLSFIRSRFFNSDCLLRDDGGQQWKFKLCSFDYFGDKTGGRITADDRLFYLSSGAVVKLDDCHVEWEYGGYAGQTNIPIFMTGNNTKFLMTGGKLFNAGTQNPLYTHLVQGNATSQLVEFRSVEAKGLGRTVSTTADDCLVAGANPGTADGNSPRVVIQNMSSIGGVLADLPAVPAFAQVAGGNRNGVDDPYAELIHRISTTGTAAVATVSAAENGISLGRYGAGKMLKITGQGKVFITLPIYELMRRHAWAFFLNSGFVTGSFTVRERQTTFAAKFDGTTATFAADARAYYSPTTVTTTGGTNAWERFSWKRCNADAIQPTRMWNQCFAIEIDTALMTAGALYLDDFAFGLM